LTNLTAEKVYGCVYSVLQEFREELTEQQIKLICDQVARITTRPLLPGEAEVDTWVASLDREKPHA
jgi:hypothetical protein